MKRIGLFVLTNLAVMVVLGITVSIVQTVFGINITGATGGLGGLLVFCAIFGFGGAFISLLMSKSMAKMGTGARVIEQPANAMEVWLVDAVRKHADKAGVKMPEVAIYDGEPNAFATGAFKNSALVAVSTGLLNAMSKDEVEAVLAHEVAHVANGDMVTLTLIQGVMNTFVLFLSRVIGMFIDGLLRRGEESSGPGIGYMISVVVLDIVFGVLAAIIVAWFSRRREFRADAGAAAYMGSTRPMISALARLGSLRPGALPQQMRAMGISGSIGALFASHPPLEQRIAALQAAGR
jgi:heat shock protein HtpX